MRKTLLNLKPLLDKFVLLFISLLLQYLVIRSVTMRTVNNRSLFFWLLSIIFFYFSFPFHFKKRGGATSTRIISGKRNLKAFFLAALFIILAICIRGFYMHDLSRFHIDEYQIAYFSHSLENFSRLDWFAVYPSKGAWVSQFPLPFFFFQKIFFLIFGISPFMIRLSILPYIFLTFLFLFLISKELFNKQVAFFSLALLSFFAPDLYLSTLGLHFISSTALFCIAFYFLIKVLKEGKKWQFGLLGLFSAFCYMTYYSSYLVLPLFIFFLIVLFLQKKIKLPVLRNFLLSLGIFFTTIGPTLTYALKVNNFFLQRFSQVSLFHGEWSPYAKQKLNPKDYLIIFKEQLIKNIQSLYRDGIGGHGGYNFGHLAFFNQITLLVFCPSLIYFLYKIVRYREFSYLSVLVILFSVFLTGMVFTIPPPAYHRSSLAFPFIAMFLGIFFESFYQFSKKFWGKKLSCLLTLTVLAILLVSNLERFHQMNKKDKKEMRENSEYLQIEDDIKRQKKKTIFISAFDSYALGRVLFFRFNGKRQFITRCFDKTIKLIRQNQTSLLIVHYPSEESIAQIKKNFPQTKILRRYQNHSLLMLF